MNNKEQKSQEPVFISIDLTEMSKKFTKEDEPINSHQMNVYTQPVYTYIGYGTYFPN